MSTRYIADLHLGHNSILRYDNRPFNSVEEMDEAMKTLWNETVKPKDTTYILGDVVWNADYKRWKDILCSLNGKKIIVKGNHDPSATLKRLKKEGIIEDWGHQFVVKENGRCIILNHSPMPFFINQHKDNWYHLYGHTHISFDYQIIQSVRRSIEELYQHEIRMYNVGCMIPGMDYAPKTLDEIIEAEKKYRDFKYDYQEIHE